MAAGMEIHSFIKIGNFFLVSGLVVLMLSMVLAVQVEVNDLIHLPPRPSEIRNFHLGDQCGTAVVAESCQKAFSEIINYKNEDADDDGKLSHECCKQLLRDGKGCYDIWASYDIGRHPEVNETKAYAKAQQIWRDCNVA